MASSDSISDDWRTGIGPVADERLPAADVAELESSTTQIGRDLLHRARERQGKGTWAEQVVTRVLAIGQSKGTLASACQIPPGLEEQVGKPYVGPHIFSDIRPEHRLANEEVFGPVLAVLRARDFEEALDWANATSYKLTGGVFSRRPSHLELARREFRVGNLYLNRGITGALVGRQPFGGFGLSGTGTQAGGPEYLLHFVEPRSICENTLRHGFAPGLD